MATSLDLDELVMYRVHMDQRGVTLDHLSQKCEDEIIDQIAIKFDTWRTTAPYLGIKKAEIKAIECNNSTEQFSKLDILHKWMNKKKDKATYLNLLLALDGADNVELIEYILDLLKEKKEELNRKADLGSLKEEDMRFICGCGQCSVQTYISNGCSDPWESSTYPLLNMGILTTRGKLDLFKILEKDMLEVQDNFQYMVSCQIQRAFREQFGDSQEVVRDLTVFVLAQQSFLFMEDNKQALLLKSELTTAETIADIFNILVHGFISWFNHLLLGSITKAFHIAEEDYNIYVEDKLVPFLQRCLFQIPKDSFSQNLQVRSATSFILKFKIPSSMDKIKGSILLPLRRHVAQILGITIESFEVSMYGNKCFELSVRAPFRLVDAIFPLSSSMLSCLGSLTVACNGLTMVSVKHGNNEQLFSNIKVSPPQDDSKIDYNSTPLSTVNRLFASLLVELHHLDHTYLSNAVRLYLTHKPIALNFQPFFNIADDESIDVIINKLTLVLSFFNFNLLELILKPLTHHDQTLNMKLQEYTREFRHLKLSDLPPLLHSSSKVDGFSSDFLIVEYQASIENVTDLISIRDSLASIHQLEPYSLVLYSIDKANCELKFLIVQNAEESIMNINSLLINRLKDAKITRFGFKDRFQNLNTLESQSDSGLSMDLSLDEDTQPTHPFKNLQTNVTFNESTRASDEQMYPFFTAMYPPSLPRRTPYNFNRGQPYPLPSPRGVPHTFNRGYPLSPRGIPHNYTGQIYHPAPPPLDIPPSFNGHFYPSQTPPMKVPPDYHGQYNLFFPFPETNVFNSDISRNVGVAREKQEPSADEWPDLTDPITKIWTSPKPQNIQQSIPQDVQPVPVVSFETGKQRQGVYKVCKTCMVFDFDHQQLADKVCLSPLSHKGKMETFAIWNEKQKLLIEMPSTLELESFPVTFPENETHPLPNITKIDKQEEIYLKKTTQQITTPVQAHTYTTASQLRDDSIKQIRQTGHNKFPIGQNVVRSPIKSQPIKSNHNLSSKERETWKCDFQKRLDNALLQNEQHFESPLSQQNYRDKFYHLLCYEESEHISLLTEKCDGQYELLFIGEDMSAKGSWLVKLGCIRGMNGDQIQYASQASEGLFIVHPITGEDICKANLSRFNYYHIDQDFEIEMSMIDARKFQEANLDKVRGKWCRVDVEFEVKHSYFNTLHRAVISLPESIIAKLLPDKIMSVKNLSHISDVKPDCHEEDNLSVDKFGQLSALEAIIKKPPLAPIILTGPFGSGKTRILARSAFEFVKIGLSRNLKTRILICAHHANTVNAYRTYLTSVLDHVQKVKIIQIAKQLDYRHRPNYCKTVSEFKHDISIGAYMKDVCIIVITTYITSLNVSEILGSFDCVFTHILLDEAAQIREPEAISSLCAAGTATKIVIAGDSKQVGPYVLVLGEEARRHGLKKSLLERLEDHYQQIGKPLSQYIQRLGVNYRCHPILTSFLADVMYSYPISCGITNTVCHPANPQSPCVFHCHSINKKSSVSFEKQMEFEADAIINQVKKYFSQIPHGWSKCSFRDVCIISSNRNQLNIIKTKLKRTVFHQIQLLPSYVVQGHEFQAVFLSTLEHLNSNGESSNPTKSLVTPRIFNTVLSRSKSLVVAIGNPFSLLKLEATMGHSETCWKKYLKLCLEKNSVTFDTEIQARHDIKKELGSLVGVVSIRPSSSQQEQHNMSAVDQQPNSDWQTVSTKVKPQRLQESQQHRVNDYKQKKKQASSPKERDNRSSHKPPEISMEDYFPSKISQPSKRTRSKKKK